MGKHHGWPIDQKTDYEAEDIYDLEAHTWSDHEEVSIVDHYRWSIEVEDKVEEPSEQHNVCLL